MCKCLSADFARMFRNKTFWLLFAGVFLIGAYVTLQQYFASFEVSVMSGTLFLYAVVVPVALSVFLPLFIGREYSDGTMRNKLVVGHSRISVYLSFLVVSFTAAFIFCVVYLSVYFAGVLLTSGFPEDGKWLIVPLLSSLALMLVFCSILVFLCMICRNRTVSAIIGILTVMSLFLFGVYANARLSEAEFYPGFQYEVTDDGAIISEEMMKNPHYLRGVKRQVYEFLDNALPGGQTIRLMSLQTERMPLKISCSAAFSVLFTAAGILVFRRKNCN